MNPIKIIVGLLLIVPAVWILIFGPRGDRQVPADRVIVDYWEKWTGNEQTQMQEIVDDFNNDVGKKKGIYVRYVSTSVINQKTLVATAAGVPPDIAGLWDNNLVQFASLDALEPLEDMAAEHGITESYYKESYWKACNWAGHLFSLISTPGAVALHYNKQAFADSGLDPDHPPQTLDELNADAAKMNRFAEHGRIARAGYLPLEPGWYLVYTYMWFGGQIWDEKNHKFTLTSKPVVDSLQWIRDCSLKLGADAANQFHAGLGNFDSPQNAFVAGTVAMEQQGPWMANYIQYNKPSFDGLEPGEVDDPNQPLAVRRARMHWAVAPFPSAVPGMKDVTFVTFDTLVIPKGAKHKKEAFEFIAYVNRQDVMEKLCNMHSKNSPLAKVSREFLEHHKNPYIDVFEKLAASPNAACEPQIPIWPEVGDELTNVANRVALMTAQPKEALEEAQDRLQKKYDMFMEKQRARHNILAGQ